MFVETSLHFSEYKAHVKFIWLSPKYAYSIPIERIVVYIRGVISPHLPRARP